MYTMPPVSGRSLSLGARAGFARAFAMHPSATGPGGILSQASTPAGESPHLARSFGVSVLIPGPCLRMVRTVLHEGASGEEAAWVATALNRRTANAASFAAATLNPSFATTHLLSCIGC